MKMASPGGSPRELVVVLGDVYECSVSAHAHATRPKQDAEELARAILDGVHAHHRYGNGAADASCLALTLVGRMADTVTARASHFSQDVLEVLLGDLDVVSQMVAKFGCEEQMVRHLAAKSASACVLYQLQVSGVVNPAWHGTCERALLSLPAGPELDACLWSLAWVLQKLLHDKREELVRMLVMAFDASVSAVASRFLPVHWSADGTGGIAGTFCLLLDLLELLTASGPMLSSRTRSPQLTYVHAAALIATVNHTTHYSVSKKVALLLKRAALHKAGEDWLGVSGESATSTADVSVLAAAVLDAFTADWLPSVCIQSPSFFGGTSATKGCGQDGKCDTAMLRAVSLLVIKSVQYHSTAATAGSGETYLARLWRFLHDKGVQPTEAEHDCAILPLLFGEQDDDMMEAAKASLIIFLQLRDLWWLDNSAPAEAPCAAGCNPHCHFLFLLRAVSWDHRILLDFLMSAETCFLEYLLRYLRFLRTDRRGFAASCRRLDADALLWTPSGERCLVHADAPDQEARLDAASQNGGGRRRQRWSSVASEQTLGRACGCLLRLHLLLARLHNKKLFPYKADALLRLLMQVTQQLSQD